VAIDSLSIATLFGPFGHYVAFRATLLTYPTEAAKFDPIPK
jgi:hypothetical protein